MTSDGLLADLSSAAYARLDQQTASGFLSRVHERIDHTAGLLDRLYGTTTDIAALIRSLVEVTLDAVAVRSAPLRALDRVREGTPDWFLRPDMVGYVCYVDRFAGTLSAVAEKLDYLGDLGVTYLHLMPLLVTRDGEDDGGYAVSDYDAIDPRLGTMSDFAALADRLHERGIALCVDLAINHTAREHVWAQRAMQGDAEYRDFYLVFEDRTLPDEFETTVPDIFPELAPGTFTFVPELNGWVWTTFREFQWDLNYANPAVFRAMLATMLRLANRGLDVVRIDAAPFLWKRLGTTCMDQPETHVLLQALRALTWMAAPGVLLKAEAMLEPDAVSGYFGNADTPECDLAYDNQAMVMAWACLATGDARLATRALGRRRPAPPGRTWVTYVRCHDDIGWAVDDADAAAVGQDGRTLRSFLSDFYAGRVPGSFARGYPFQRNAFGAHPISGTAASLCGVEEALDRDDDELLRRALRRMEAIYSVVFSIGGIPLIYMGDELAMTNDVTWAVDPVHAGDNRWMHRPAMDWKAAARRSDPATLAGAMYRRLHALSHVRGATAALDGTEPTTVIVADEPGLLAYRRGGDGGLLAAVNVTAREIAVDEAVLQAAGIREPQVVHRSVGVDRPALLLGPYEFVWLRERT